MPSNQYTGRPKLCLLCSTAEGHRPIDLLNRDGISITNPPGWIPGVTKLKGGGVRIGSESLDDDWLVAGGYEAVAETFPITVDPKDTAARVQTLLARLQEAEQYWIDGWQRESVYLMVQLTEDHDIRYTRIKTGSYQIGDYAFGGRAGLPNNTLVLEREPYWNGVPPQEMVGPFANWCPNPSFEYWSEDGITDTLPTGWTETLVAGSKPATWETRREDQQVAGPDYALDMNFSAAAATGDWRLRTEMSWPGSPETATLRFWLFLTLPAATHTFEVRIREKGAGAAVATATFTSDYQGYYYLSVDAPMLDDNVYLVELRWSFAIAGTGGRAVIDHICFTPGDFDASTWPTDDFYLTCSNVWNWEDDEMHMGEKVTVTSPRHPLNFFDVMGVPGSAPAIMEMNISHLGEKYGEDKNYPIINYALGSQVHKAGVRNTDERHISMNLDGAGYTGISETDTSSESLIDAPVTSTYSAVYCWRADAIAETDLYTGRFKVFGRMRWVPDTPGTSATLQLEHWIGSQVGLLQQDEVILTESDQYRMVNLTPRSVVDWGLQADDPAALGLRLNAKSDVDGTLYLDFILLCPMDAGLITTTFDQDTPWLVGQAISVDGNPNHQPVAITAPFFPWVRESSMLLVGEGLESWIAMDAEAFTGSLYVAMFNADVTYTYQRWIPVRWRTASGIGTQTLYPIDIVNNGFDTATLIGAAKMQADGDDLRVFDGGIEIYRWLQDINTATTQVWCNLDFDPPQEGTITANIGAGDVVTSVTINEATTGFPSFGIFMINNEAFTYESKNDSTKTFSGIQRAERNTTAAAHTSGDTLWWVQHDLYIKYGNAVVGAPTVDDDYKPALRLDSTNTSWDYDDFGDNNGKRTGRWSQVGSLGSYTFYTGNRTANANPWAEMGITTQNASPFTSQAYWHMANFCGINNINFQNGEKRSTSRTNFEAYLYSGNPGFNLEYTVPIPSANNVWENWNYSGAVTSAPQYEIDFYVISSPSAGTNDCEVADVTLTLDSTHTPTLTIGDEAPAAQGKLLRFDHRGWVQIITRDDPLRALETWGAYLYYIQDTTIGRYRASTGAEDFATGATSYYDLRAYNGLLFLASDAGKIFYANNTGTITESIDLGTQTWWCLETYKRKLYAGADTGEIAEMDGFVSGWSILTDLGNDVRTLKAWNGKLYASVDGGGVYAYDGDTWANVLSYNANYGEMGRLEVYDDLLFVGTGNNGGNAYVIYTEDGINWTENIFPASAPAMAMEPFDGRLFIGFGFLFGASEWASEWLLWHTREVPKLYLTEHTGGPFALYPDRINRYYQMMEVLNVDATPDREECYLERGIGPQTHFGISFVPRWHALRED